MTRMLFGRQTKWLPVVAVLCLLAGCVAAISPLGQGLASTYAASAQSAQITVNAGQATHTFPDLGKGLNTAVWDANLLDNASSSAVKSVGITALRYPGGSTSDVYHWQSNTTESGQSYANPSNTFDAFMNMTTSVGAQPIITVDYGAGTPQEAAGWVQYANKGGTGYTGPVPTYSGGSGTGHTYGIKYWEIGNELYGDGTYGANWEYNNKAHTAATYANNVVSYSQAMKAVDSTVKIGAVLTAPGNWPDGVTNAASPQPWNTTVLSTACSSLDFAVVHWYPQNPGNESDTTLLSSTAQISGMVSTLRSEFTQYCGSHASAIQILVTETNSVSSNPGKQTLSVVNAIYEADDYMSWLENGVTNVDWWTLHNSATAGNTSSSLYGNTQYGDYGVLANGSCTSDTSGICEPAANTPFPAYYGLQMLNYLGQAGDALVSASSNQSSVVVHAVKQANGNLAVLLLNKDPNNSYTVGLGLNGYNAASTTKVYTYGEDSASITSASGSSTSVTIAPYSLTTVVLHSDASGTPTPVPTITSTPTPPSGSCKVKYTVSNQWPGGFSANLTITNTGSAAINGWSLQFAFANGQKITQFWNGIYIQNGANVTITNLSYNGTIPAGGTVSSAPGFNGSWSGMNSVPTSFKLNGSLCSIE